MLDFHDVFSPPKLEKIPILWVGLLELLFPAKNLTYTSPSLTCNLKISAFQKEALIPKCHFSGFHNPYHPCMVYLPTFTINIW